MSDVPATHCTSVYILASLMYFNLLVKAFFWCDFDWTCVAVELPGCTGIPHPGTPVGIPYGTRHP